jgi:hypothetical protein
MRERRQTYRIRLASQEPIEALLHVGGRDVTVDLKDESLEGFGIQFAQDLSVNEGDEVHLLTPQGWFAATVVRVIWNSDGSVYVGLRRGPAGRPAGRRDSISRTTLVLAVAAGALLVPLLTFLLGQSAGRLSPARPLPPETTPHSAAPQNSEPLAKTSAAKSAAVLPAPR